VGFEDPSLQGPCGAVVGGEAMVCGQSPTVPSPPRSRIGLPGDRYRSLLSEKETSMMGTEDRRKADRNQECSCPGRRDFLASLGHLGGAAVVVNLGLFRWSTRSVLGAPRLPGERGAQPLIRVAFCQAGPDDILQAGWPGLAYDDDASQALYTRTLERAAAELGIALDVRKERLGGHDAADAFLSETLERNADGIVLTNMDGHVYGIQAVHRILDQRGDRDLPVLVFVPHGTLHANPGVYQRFREAPHCFVGATAEVDWLAQGLRMLKARWQMAHTRLAVVTGDVEREETLEPLGTVLHYVPIQTYVDLYEGTGDSEQVRGIAELYEEMSKDILEPSRDDLRQAARAYVASRRLLEETGCHGVTMDCFPHVAKRRLPHIFPPCLAFMQLLDEGSTGGCEADVFPALTELLSSYLLGRPGVSAQSDLRHGAQHIRRRPLQGAHPDGGIRRGSGALCHPDTSRGGLRSGPAGVVQGEPARHALEVSVPRRADDRHGHHSSQCRFPPRGWNRGMPLRLRDGPRRREGCSGRAGASQDPYVRETSAHRPGVGPARRSQGGTHYGRNRGLSGFSLQTPIESPSPIGPGCPGYDSSAEGP
jgi:hypothetical protein